MAEMLLRAAPDAADPAAALTACCGELGGRLAQLLDGLAPDDVLRPSLGFLRRMASEPVVPQAPPALLRVATALNLGELELDLIVLAGLADEHEGYASILRGLHPAGEPAVSAGLAAQLAGDGRDDRRRLSETLRHGAAVAAGALRLAGDGPFFDRSLALPPGLWAVLGGGEAAPGEGTVPAGEPIALGGLEDWLGGDDAARAVRALAADEALTIVVTADSEDTALARGRALAAAAGRTSLAVRAEQAGPAVQGSVGAHALARGAVAVVGLVAGEQPAMVPAFDALPATAIVCCRPGHPSPPTVRPLLVVACAPLRASARRRMWRAAVPALASDAPRLAVRHAVEPHVAARAAADLTAMAAVDRRAPTATDLGRSVRGRAAASLPTGATLRQPTAGWEALVLSRDREAQLREALARLEHQALVLDDWGFQRDRPGARGVRMLLAGPPGTGKTLSAEVLAHALGADLLVVDIARVVSKWIGETEKNLAEIFEAAERSQAVLLFDEADAFFGRRTEVSDAHDRYANLETAYLLQRLEAFEGLAILSTNLRHNIDAAFIRRLEFVIEYEDPGPAERRALWDCHLPPGAPLADDVSLDDFAVRFALSGALIRNAAMSAAFLAADRDEPIGRAHVLSAIHREYDKHGRAFPAAANPRRMS